ncbi:hypothetical protein F441_12886 [Phytophthora nicotianae CJ01A1]|uniref:Uncharacterized protein n=1 Tax=Phytophthora nicotianae CJ01A1 TaxID=1317063 RepID=W2WM60_PHYNI|nr:hypothetical protein F441_12886 [Phytophthora nicotianae CJ01A1]
MACATEHDMASMQATIDFIDGFDVPHADLSAETELLELIDDGTVLNDLDHSSKDDASFAMLDKFKFGFPTWNSSSSSNGDDDSGLDCRAQCRQGSPFPTRRRQRKGSRKEELEELRTLATKLAKKLQLMKSAALQDVSPYKVENALVKTLWKDIAVGQFMLRRTTEARNVRLRKDVMSYNKTAANLKRMLKRRYSEEMLELMPIEKRARSLECKTSSTNEQIFRELLETINDVYTSVDALFVNKGMTKLPCPSRAQNAHPKTTNGLFIELKDKTQVPFSADQTAKAVWKAMCGQKTRDGDIVDAKLCVHDTQQTEDTITSYMNYTCNASGHASFVQESGVARKYVEHDRVLFISSNLVEPTIRSHGALALSFQETVVTVVRMGNTLASGQETAVIESYLWVDRRDDGREIALKFRDAAFVDIAIDGWNKKLSLYSERIENILFDDALNVM